MLRRRKLTRRPLRLEVQWIPVPLEGGLVGGMSRNVRAISEGVYKKECIDCVKGVS